MRKYNMQRFDNAKSALKSAILGGRVQYQGGYITGKISAKISREVKKLGGTFDKRRKAWHLPTEIAPGGVIAASVSANERIKAMYEEVIQALQPERAINVIEKSSFADNYTDTLNGIEGQFKASVSTIGVKPQISEDMVTTLAEQYSENMKLYIKKWAEPQILKLREQVTQNAFNGARAENLVKTIQKEYGVSQRKAKFLAKQETKLITSKFNIERYKSVGVTKYKWSTSNDSRVREDHKELNGKVFQWDEAVIDDHGNRGNPGEAFGCRCIARPVFE